ncbi:hypothetical protein [Nocardioides sp. B-3]|uniref:hypothetical protein n=1 Tax=Nocardioides sp. B-3 TaxID=2895565 RepID=UPI003FA53C0E
MATSTLATSEQCELHLLLPTAAVDELLASDRDGTLDIVVDDDTITLTGDSVNVRAHVPDVDFPPYRNWLEIGRREFPVDAATLQGRTRCRCNGGPHP